jgi:hypothetical protein
MARKSKPEEVEAKKAQEDTPVLGGGAGDGREPSIQESPEQSFEERTGVGTPPWLKEDGSQDNGLEDEPAGE